MLAGDGCSSSSEPPLIRIVRVLLTKIGERSHVTNNWNAGILMANVTIVLIGIASFFLMPQSPARTKSWWNPKGYFTEKEQKMIVNAGK